MRRFFTVLSVCMALVLFAGGQGHAAFSVAAWNLESGDSDERFLATQIEAWKGFDVWGFSEVREGSVLEILGASLNAANPGANYMGIIGTTGRADKLGIVFSSKTLECLGSWQLHEVNVGGTLRAPLVAQFRELATGEEFLFVVNHFYRGRASEEKRRDQQSSIMREWARRQQLPVIAVGDYNFDCQVERMGQCNNSFNVLTEGDVLQWAVPENPIRTQCNRRYNSILDFIFVSKDAVEWVGQSVILNAAREACDDNATKADHRPVAAQFLTQ